MSEKLNIFINIEDLTIEGDIFKYKYSYEDIVYMIETLEQQLSETSKKQTILQGKLDKVNEAVTQITANVTMLGQIKAAIEAADPSTYAQEEEIMEEPIEEPPII